MEEKTETKKESGIVNETQKYRTKKLRKMPQPDVEVKRNVRFDLELVLLCGLKNAVVSSIIVLEQLAVQKPEKKGDISN